MWLGVLGLSHTRSSSLVGTTAPTLMGETEASRGRVAGLRPPRSGQQAHSPRDHRTLPLGRDRGPRSVGRSVLETAGDVSCGPCECASLRRETWAGALAAGEALHGGALRTRPEERRLFLQSTGKPSELNGGPPCLVTLHNFPGISRLGSESTSCPPTSDGAQEAHPGGGGGGHGAVKSCWRAVVLAQHRGWRAGEAWPCRASQGGRPGRWAARPVRTGQRPREPGARGSTQEAQVSLKQRQRFPERPRRGRVLGRGGAAELAPWGEERSAGGA